MTDIRRPTRTLKTEQFDAYEELTPNIGDRDASDEYPFEAGFELFSAGLAVGYINDDGELIEEEAERLESSEEESEDDQNDQGGDTSYHPFFDLQEVLKNNEDHAYTIELIDRVIAIELASELEQDDGSVPEDVWDLVVAHADKGVGIIRQEWKQDKEIDVGDRIDELDDFWEDKIDQIADDLTQIPQREDDGRIQSGD
ncbi:hypothetical protein [Halovenus sp. HT40]|uniref:hypothetical protein n=1 Tax=Halovenus sp. HT40 TaxID=3126691 RepID=UPI00300EAA25